MAIATSRPVSMWLGLSTERSADRYLEGSPLDRNVFAVLLALGLIVLMSRRSRVVPLLKSNWALVLFYVYCALSILWSDFPDVTFKRWIKAIGEVVMVLVVLTERDPTAAIMRLFARTAFVFAPLSLLFIRYYGHLGRGYSRWEGEVSYTGIAVDKNMLGMACLVFGLALLWRLLKELIPEHPRWKSRSHISPGGQRIFALRAGSIFTPRMRSVLAHSLVVAMLVSLLVISNSMTSLGCFVFASGLMVAMTISRFARKRAVIHLVVAGIVCAVPVILFADVGGVLLEQVGRGGTLTGRTELWPIVIALTDHPVLGTGFESFWLGERLQKIWDVYWWHPNEAHNGYLEIYVTLGWVGLGLVAAVAINGYRSIIEMVRYDPVGAKLRLAYFVVAIAYNFTESAFKTLHPIWFAFLLAVVVVPRPRVRTATPKHRARQLAAPEPAAAFAGSHGGRNW
jgi:O-antigen ligase